MYWNNIIRLHVTPAAAYLFHKNTTYYISVAQDALKMATEILNFVKAKVSTI
jgi:hypothetical protein